MELIKKSFEVYDLLSEDDKTTINEIILETISKFFDTVFKIISLIVVLSSSDKRS